MSEEGEQQGDSEAPPPLTEKHGRKIYRCSKPRPRLPESAYVRN